MAITDPRDISGLRLWLSADAITGLSDNTNMSTWSDLSGNGFNGTVTGAGAVRYRTTAGSSGGPAVQFIGSAWFAFGDVMASASAGEMMMTVKHDSTGGDTGAWAWGASSGNNDESHYPFSGVVYEAFGLASGQRQSFTPGVSIDSWRRYNVWSASSDWAARLDETSQATTATATPTWVTTPTIGAGKKSGSVDLKFVGWIGCVVVYNRKLTTTERSDLATWLTSNPSGAGPAAHSLGASWSVDLQYTAFLAEPRPLASSWTVDVQFVNALLQSMGTWGRDESQKYRIEYVYGADLTTGKAAVSPPTPYTPSGSVTGVTGTRNSPVWPTPTLDSRGHPT